MTLRRTEHVDLEIVLLPQVVEDLLEGRVAQLDVDTRPQRHLLRAELGLLRRHRLSLREVKEHVEAEVHKQREGGKKTHTHTKEVPAGRRGWPG